MSLESYASVLFINSATIGGAALCICVVMLLSYFVYAFSIREKSFEEVIAEQKERTIWEELQQKQEKGKKEKEKKHKKWDKKKKEKSDQGTDATKEVHRQSQTLPDVDSEIEIVEPKDIVVKKKPKSTPKQGNAKETTANEKLPKAVVESSVSVKEDKKEKSSVPVKEERKEKSSNTVKEDKKEKSSNTVKEDKKEKSGNLVKEEKKEKPETVVVKEKAKLESQKVPEPSKPKIVDTEYIQPEVAVAVQVSPVSTSGSKKKKKVDQPDKEDQVRVTANKLISLINETNLDDEDNQLLIHALLNKQKEASGWKKTGDVQSGGKKQAGIQEKLKTPLERSQQEKLSSQQQEIQTLTLRMKQTEEELLAEKKAAHEKVLQLEKAFHEKSDAALKKSQEEKAQLAKTVKQLEADAKANTLGAELEKAKKSKDSLQVVHNLLVEEHTMIHSTHKSEMKRLNAETTNLTHNMEKYQKENATLLQELETSKGKSAKLAAAKKTLEQELKAAENSTKTDVDQLQTLFKSSKDLDLQGKKLSGQVDELTRQNQLLSVELTNMRNENERLSAALAASNERVNGDGQEGPQQNGEINEKELEDIKSKLEKEKKINKDFSSQMTKLNSLVKIGQDALLQEQNNVLQLQNQLSEKAKEDQNVIEKEKTLQEKEHAIKKLYMDIDDLNKEIEQQKQKNNELREKNWKTMEALKSEEKVSEQKVIDAENAANARIKEAEEMLRAAQCNTADADRAKELSERLGQTKEQLQILQKESGSNLQKYESTFKENCRLISEMQQLQELKVSLETRITQSQELADKLQLEIQKSEVSCKECLQRLFPSVSLNNSLPYTEWLVEFEKQALASAQVSSNENIEELQARLVSADEERNDLKNRVSHYNKTLAETEDMLKNLMDSAKTQESEFLEKVKAHEQEVENALKSVEIAEKEKEELKCRIQQLDQLQADNSTLQSTLNSFESEKSIAEQKYEEVNRNYINLKDQIDSKDVQVAELQKQIASFDSFQKELEDVKSKLEKEKKINKDFSSQMIKLNSLVKIGQDALQQEQENVLQLQSQLSEKLATANGTSSPTITAEDEDASSKK